MNHDGKNWLYEQAYKASVQYLEEWKRAQKARGRRPTELEFQEVRMSYYRGYLDGAAKTLEPV
jgi:hypothetical protein